MKRLSSFVASLAACLLASCAATPSAPSEPLNVLGTWSGYVTAADRTNSPVHDESTRARGGWTLYPDGLAITSRGIAGRWRPDGDKISIRWDAAAWGENARGPRRIYAEVAGETLTATWTQVNTTRRERYVMTANFRRLARPEMCAPPEAQPEEMRHAILVWTLEAGVDDIRDVRFSHDGARLAVGSNDARVRLFDVASGRLLMQSEPAGGPIWNVAFAQDGRHVISFGPSDREFNYYMWNPTSAEGVLTRDYEALWNVADSESAESRDGTLRYERGSLISRTTGTVVAETVHGSGSVTAAVFSYDGSALVVRHGLYETRVHDGRTGAPLSRLCGTTNGSNPVRVSANGVYVSTQEYGAANSPHVVAVWRVASGAIVARLRAPYGSLWAQDISPAGDLLATGSRDGRVRIWRLAPGPGPIPLIGPSLAR